ncbi:FadR/GntR family transcriptional regulator [Hydrogenophaga sp. OTU3427]|uniref:FadR/GntR family transcriptional regulator n=1 Tax=Hydrogenophaga sp. OTU3427 TaxID=3043856 RepID=UPI00313C0A83
MSSPHSTPHRALSHRLVTELSADIRNGVLCPGDRLPIEPELARRFGVSRTVVRESIQRLQVMGVVQTRHGIGTFVLPPPPAAGLLIGAGADVGLQQVLFMLELRISVEAEAAALAAARRTDTQLEAMRAALNSFDTALHAGHSTLAADFQFHCLVAQATHNPYFEEVLSSLGRVTISGVDHLRRDGSPDPKASMPVAQFGVGPSGLVAGKTLTAHEHEGLLDNIQRGDAMGARAAMLVHLSNSRERLRRAAVIPD